MLQACRGGMEGLWGPVADSWEFEDCEEEEHLGSCREGFPLEEGWCEDTTWTEAEAWSPQTGSFRGRCLMFRPETPNDPAYYHWWCILVALQVYRSRIHGGGSSKWPVLQPPTRTRANCFGLTVFVKALTYLCLMSAIITASVITSAQLFVYRLA